MASYGCCASRCETQLAVPPVTQGLSLSATGFELLLQIVSRLDAAAFGSAKSLMSAFCLLEIPVVYIANDAPSSLQSWCTNCSLLAHVDESPAAQSENIHDSTGNGRVAAMPSSANWGRYTVVAEEMTFMPPGC